MELMVGALTAGLVGGLTETVQRAGRRGWEALTSLVSRRRGATGGAVEPGTAADEGSGSATGSGADVPPGKYHVVVNGGRGVACGDRIIQKNHFH
ncbi:hypothetical protein ACIQNG_13850 [Streptomyces sp. NPDC091377]|uniref:hypothetical protein n=1 Tax=unclassified Streptomyces TaxID=2593676 RepID=UPI003802D6F2